MVVTTSHAIGRMQQRGLQPSLVDLILENGRPTHAAGAVFYFVGDKDVPDHLPASVKERLIGGTVVVSRDTGDVITVYRNRSANRHIRRKQRYNRISGRRPLNIEGGSHD